MKYEQSNFQISQNLAQASEKKNTQNFFEDTSKTDLVINHSEKSVDSHETKNKATSEKFKFIRWTDRQVDKLQQDTVCRWTRIAVRLGKLNDGISMGQRKLKQNFAIEKSI